MNIRLKSNIFNEIYLPHLFDYSHRYNLYYGGAGSGKSHFVVQKIIIKATNEQRRVLFIRKVARTIKNTIFQQVIDTLSFFQILPYCKVNKTDYHIELPNGSVLLFSGLDDSEKIKSIVGISDIVIEEASEINIDDFSQLDLRLRSPLSNNQIYLMTNPISRANWIYKHFFENGTPQDTFILHTTYTHNRFLPEAYVAALKELERTNPIYYRIYTLGEFGSLSKLVYNNWRLGEAPLTKSQLQVLVGIDFGYSNDPSAIITSYVDTANKIIYIDKEVYEKGLLNTDIYDRVVALGVKKEIIYADAAEPKSIEELRRLGLSRIRPAIKGPGSVNAGIQQLQQYTLVVNPNCINMIRELENYAYKRDKSTKEYINEPEDAFNHGLDALRYSIQTINTQNALRTTTKQSLGL